MSRTESLQRILGGFHSFKHRLARRTTAYRITGAQWLALHAIAEHERLSVKELGRSLGISSSAATQIVQGLVKGGHVKRQADPGDARATLLTLTPSMRRTLARVRTAALAEMERLFSVLSDREFAQYLALHEKIAAHCTP